MTIILIAMRITVDTEHVIFKELRDVFERTWSNTLLFIIAAFCQQGFDLRSRLISGRIVAFFVLLFSLLVYQFYSASIVSYLLRDPPRSIKTIDDLRKSSLRAGIEDILIDRAFIAVNICKNIYLSFNFQKTSFQETSYESAIQLYNEKIKNTNNNSGFYEPEDGLRLVKDGGFAFHVETSTAYPIIEETFTNELICELEEVQMYRTQPMHTNLQKNSPFKEMLNYWYCVL